MIKTRIREISMPDNQGNNTWEQHAGLLRQEYVRVACLIIKARTHENIMPDNKGKNPW